MTRIKKTKTRGAGVNSPHDLIALVRDQERITDEIQVALLEIFANQELGLEQDKWMRVISGIKNHRMLNINAINRIQDVLTAAMGHIQKLEGQDKTSAVEQWLDRILDPTQ